MREHGVEKQYLQLPVHMLILKKNSYTNTKIPTPINLFILVLVIHVQQSYKLFDYAITKGVKMNSGFATFFCLQRECKF